MELSTRNDERNIQLSSPMTHGNNSGTHHGEDDAPKSNYANGDPDTHFQLLRDIKNALIEKQDGYLDRR